MANLINWLEIPVSDMDRAKKFYEAVLQAEIRLDEETAPGLKMGMIFTENMDMKDVGGALIEGAGLFEEKGLIVAAFVSPSRQGWSGSGLFLIADGEPRLAGVITSGLAGSSIALAIPTAGLKTWLASTVCQ